MTKMGTCMSTGQPEGQTMPAPSSKLASPSTAPVQPTPYQQKAIKALKNMGTKSGPPLKEWTLPVSDDPNVELLVFPLLHFEGYMAGKESGEDGQSNKSADGAKTQTQAAAQQQESPQKAEHDKGGRVASFEHLGAGEGGAFPEGRADGSGEESERKLALKRLIETRIDSSPWPPSWDEIEAEVRRVSSKKYEEADEKETQNEVADAKQTKEKGSAIKGEGQDSFDYWGFLPADYPLSDTDSEADDPVKERQDRVLRSRKRQVKAHFTDAIASNLLSDWAEIFAQARILEIKYIDDDFTYAQKQAKLRGTSWIKQLPTGGKWLSSSYECLDAIIKKYASVVTDEMDKVGDVNALGDQLKAMVLASAQLKELMTALPQGLQADLDAAKEEHGEAAGTEMVLGFKYVSGPDGAPCIGVKIRKNREGGA